MIQHVSAEAPLDTLPTPLQQVEGLGVADGRGTLWLNACHGWRHNFLHSNPPVAEIEGHRFSAHKVPFWLMSGRT